MLYQLSYEDPHIGSRPIYWADKFLGFVSSFFVRVLAFLSFTNHNTRFLDCVSNDRAMTELAFCFHFREILSFCITQITRLVTSFIGHSMVTNHEMKNIYRNICVKKLTHWKIIVLIERYIVTIQWCCQENHFCSSPFTLSWVDWSSHKRWWCLAQNKSRKLVFFISEGDLDSTMLPWHYHDMHSHVSYLDYNNHAIIPVIFSILFTFCHFCVSMLCPHNDVTSLIISLMKN